MNKYDYPFYIDFLEAPKSNWNNLININDKLKNRVALNLSMQSLKIYQVFLILNKEMSEKRTIH